MDAQGNTRTRGCDQPQDRGQNQPRAPHDRGDEIGNYSTFKDKVEAFTYFLWPPVQVIETETSQRSSQLTSTSTPTKLSLSVVRALDLNWARARLFLFQAG